MKKITLLMSVIALVFSTGISAQEIFTENFDDGLAVSAGRMFVVENAGSVNVANSAQAYADLSVDVLENGGTHCFKVEVNSDGNSAAFYGLAPMLDDPLTTNYTMLFDAWINFKPGGDGSTEYLRYGISHDGGFPFKTDSYRLADGLDFAFDGDNGSRYDLQMYGDSDGDGVAEDLDYVADASWIYADGVLAEQNGNVDDVTTLYQRSFDDSGDILAAPGNRWLKVALVVSGKDVVYYVNGVEWARIEGLTIAEGYPVIGYMDKYTSLSGPDGFLLIDNIEIHTGDKLSINERELSNVSIYPNPAKGMVNVSVEGKANFQLFNISGQSVMNMDIKGTTSVDISSLNSGMYFSRITSETGATKTLKLQVK